MDVRRLELLRELADRGSVTAVAAATHRTPSAVSQQLKVLEREAGIALTERAGRGLALTGAGQALAAAARELSVAVQHAEATWADFTGSPVGEVRLATFPTGGEMLLPGLLPRIAAVPGLRLICTDRDPLNVDFVDLTPDHDIVLADAPGVARSWLERGLVVTELMREQLDVAMPEGHTLAARRSLSPADVIGEPWIGVPIGLPFDRILQRIEAITGREADVLQRFTDNGIAESLVAAGHGIAILPRFTTRDRENGIETRPLTGLRSERVIWAIQRSDHAARPSVRRVVEELVAAAGDFVAQHEAPRAG